MGSRTALSKRTRFEVFKRDEFRCVYCGSTPNDGPLHVDHVVAVANGGGDDLPNLVTACAACNLGKSSVPLTNRAPAMDPEASAEQAEQIRAWLEAQRSVVQAHKFAEQEMVNLWCDTFGTEGCDWEVPGRLLKILNEWPMSKLCEALRICATNRRLYRDVARLKYLYGILRNWRAETNGAGNA
jgi:hypothetical protein